MSYVITFDIWEVRIMSFSVHYFHTCPSIPTFHNRSKQNIFQVRIVITTGWIVYPDIWIWLKGSLMTPVCLVYIEEY